MKYLFNESIGDTVIVYAVLRRLVKPWIEWPAYTAGIIDENGKKIKDPVSLKEREAWTVLDRVTYNMKKVLEKFVGGSKLGAYLTAAFLLKEQFNGVITKHLLENVFADELSEMTLTKQKNLHYMMKTFPLNVIQENKCSAEETINSYNEAVEKFINENTADVADLFDYSED